MQNYLTEIERVHSRINTVNNVDAMKCVEIAKNTRLYEKNHRADNAGIITGANSVSVDINHIDEFHHEVRSTADRRLDDQWKYMYEQRKSNWKRSESNAKVSTAYVDDVANRTFPEP